MIPLQTIVDISDPEFRITYYDNILTLGSCFSDNIANRLKKIKFNTLSNPFGVLYNPASISQAIDILINKDIYSENDLDYFNERWFSFQHYTGFSDPDKTTCLKKINSSMTTAKAQLKKSSIIIITLGTAWIFRYRKTGNIVSNCHKIPATEFQREFLTIQNIIETLSSTFQLLKEINNNIKIILTISPIRHWKDGAIENFRSKATLALSIKELEKLFDNLYYFPVYEIFMDELRDYRFYASDMLHPSEYSIEYIWHKFSETFFTRDTRNIITEVEKITRSYEHRPVNKKTEQFHRFVTALEKKSMELIVKYPFLDFTEELGEIKKI